MTSPESRPRVEGERVAFLAAMSDETVAGNFPAGGTMRALSRDLLDARAEAADLRGFLEEAGAKWAAVTTENERLTAEVARLRGEMAVASRWAAEQGRGVQAAYFAALALPTPAPEGTDGK